MAEKNQKPRPSRKSAPGTGRRRQKQQRARKAAAKMVAGLPPSRQKEAIQAAAELLLGPEEKARLERLKDARTQRRAFFHGWGVPDQFQPDIVAEHYEIVMDPATPIQDKIKAAKFLLAADTTEFRRKLGIDGQQNFIAILNGQQVPQTKEIATPEEVLEGLQRLLAPPEEPKEVKPEDIHPPRIHEGVEIEDVA